jgi:hypothetical protein
MIEARSELVERPLRPTGVLVQADFEPAARLQ